MCAEVYGWLEEEDDGRKATGRAAGDLVIRRNGDAAGRERQRVPGPSGGEPCRPESLPSSTATSLGPGQPDPAEPDLDIPPLPEGDSL